MNVQKNLYKFLKNQKKKTCKMSELIKLIESGEDSEIIEYFLKKGIIKIPANCNKKLTCKGNPLVIRKRRNVGDDLWWRCTKCLTYTSIRNNSFLSMFKLPLKKIIKLIFNWAIQFCNEDICKIVGVCKQTVTSFNQELRLIAVLDLKREQIVLGGPGVEVQIDESMFIRVKHHKGKDLRRSQVWVFGLYDKENKLIVFVVVPSRDAYTLLNIIYKYVAPRSVIHSDCWKSYSRIDKLDKNYTHKQVNHNLHFVATDGTHTQDIESRWCSVKMQVKRMRGVNRDYLQSYLDEYCWRFNNGSKRFDQFDEICEAIGRNWVSVDMNNVNELSDRFKNLAMNKIVDEALFDFEDDEDFNFTVPELPDCADDALVGQVVQFEDGRESHSSVFLTQTSQRISIRNNLVKESQAPVPDNPHVQEILDKPKSPKSTSVSSSYNLRSKKKV